MPGAHITLLDPFLAADEVDEGVIAELRELFADLVPFAYVLGEPARFPSGAAYLPPQPVGVFRRITHSLRRAFPEVIGPATSLDTVIPHLAAPRRRPRSPRRSRCTPARRCCCTGRATSEDTTSLATSAFGTRPPDGLAESARAVRRAT